VEIAIPVPHGTWRVMHVPLIHDPGHTMIADKQEGCDIVVAVIFDDSLVDFLVNTRSPDSVMRQRSRLNDLLRKRLKKRSPISLRSLRERRCNVAFRISY
jgi:glyoxylase-like metal-dependent hydrolase (beta-lactamase superfamily II)